MKIEPDYVVPIVRTSLTMDILLDNPIKTRNETQKKPEMTFFPSDMMNMKVYAGKDILDPEDLKSKDIDLIKRIQKVYRGHLSRKWVKVPLKPSLEIIQSGKEGERERDPIEFLRNVEVNPKYISHLMKKKEQEDNKGDYERLFGMTLQELIISSNRDAFEKLDRYKDSKMYSRYTRLDNSHTQMKDNSGIHTSFDQQKNLSFVMKNKSEVSNFQGRYDDGSDDIEDAVESYKEDSESIIEEMMQKSMSLSVSRSRSRGRRAKRSTGKNRDDRMEKSIYDNESSGFGFIKEEKKATIIKPAKVNGKKSDSEILIESDSDPFGVGKKDKPIHTVIDKEKKLTESHLHDSVLSNKDRTRGGAQEKNNVRARNLSEINNALDENKGKDGGIDKYIELDRNIYDDGFLRTNQKLDRNKSGKHNKYAISTNINISEKNRNEVSRKIKDELEAMKKNIKELEDFNEKHIGNVSNSGMITRNAKDINKDVVMRKMIENEGLMKRLINKIIFVREQSSNSLEAEYNQKNEGEKVGSIDEKNIEDIVKYVRECVLDKVGLHDGSIQYNEMISNGNTDSPHMMINNNNHNNMSFDELYNRTMQSKVKIDKYDQIHDEKNLKDLEDRVEKLQDIDEELNDILNQRKQAVEKELNKREIDRAISRELAERRKRMNRVFDTGEKKKSHTIVSSPSQNPHQSEIYSDYNESKEVISISWIGDSNVSIRQNKKYPS